MFLLLPLSVSAIKGKERVQTLGIRGSAGGCWDGRLTFGVSLLIRFGWQAAFLGLRHQHSYLTFVSLICCPMDLRTEEKWRKNTGMSR